MIVPKQLVYLPIELVKVELPRVVAVECGKHVQQVSIRAPIRAAQLEHSQCATEFARIERTIVVLVHSVEQLRKALSAVGELFKNIDDEVLFVVGDGRNLAVAVCVQPSEESFQRLRLCFWIARTHHRAKFLKGHAALFRTQIRRDQRRAQGVTGRG